MGAHHLLLPTPGLVLPAANQLSWISAASGLTLNGNQIAAVANRTAGAGAATQPTSSLQPLLAVRGGNNVIACTATGAEHLLLSVAGGSKQTLYVVCYIQAYAANGAMLWGIGSSSLYWFPSDDTNVYVEGAGSPVPLGATALATHRAQGKLVLLTLYPRGSATGVRVNGSFVSQAGGAPVAVPAGTLTGRINTYSAGSNWNGKVEYAEHILYNGEPTDAEMAAIEGPLKAYYSL